MNVDYSPNFRPEKSIFVLSLVLPGGPPQALVPVGALSDHGLVYFIFHCNNHVTSFFTRHWELRFDVAPELGLLRGLSCGVRSFDEGSGSLAMRSVQYRRVLPQWRCSIERIPPERLARPISQACTRRMCSRGFGARPLASPSPTDAPKNSCKQDPARQLTRFSRETII